MKLKQILLYIFLFFLPTQLGKHFFFPFSIINGVRIDYLAPTVYLTDIFIILLFFVYFREIKIPKNKKLYILFSLIILTIVFALSPWIALYKLFKYVEILALFVIILKSKLSAKLLLIIFALSTLLQLGISIIQVVYGQSIQGLFYFLGERYFTISTPGIAKVALQGKEILRAYGTFSHPNSLSGFYLLLYTFILFEKKFDTFLKLKYFILGLSSILIFVSFSKISISIFFIINVLYLFKNSTCKYCSAARIIGLLVISFLFISAKGDSESIQKRISLIQDSIQIIGNYPFFGVGFGNYIIAQSKFPIGYSYYFLQPVHNIFLLFLAEIGIPLFILIFYFIYKFVKELFTKHTAIVTPLLIVIIGTGFFDHYWLTLQQNLLLLPVVFGLLKNQKWQ